MLRSMYSGISGLKNHQTKLDVIGNNISNVNTYGFKKGRVVFKDLISQTTAGASGASATTGGRNAMQVGLGSQMAAIDTLHGTGSMQTTSRTLDLAISGDGFFMVGNTPGADADTDQSLTNVQYTRAGNMYMDADGFLVDSNGNYLVGITEVAYNSGEPPFEDGEIDDANYPLMNEEGEEFEKTNIIIAGFVAPEFSAIQIPTNAQSMSIGQDGTVTFVDAEGDLRYAGQIAMAKFSNAGGLEKVGNNYYQVTDNSGQPFYAAGTEGGMGTINSGFLEMSNVDLSEEFTEMIVAQRGFQANSRIITTSDQILEELVNLKR